MELQKYCVLYGAVLCKFVFPFVHNRKTDADTECHYYELLLALYTSNVLFAVWFNQIVTSTLGTYNVLNRCYIGPAFCIPTLSVDPLRCPESGKFVCWNKFGRPLRWFTILRITICYLFLAAHNRIIGSAPLFSLQAVIVSELWTTYQSFTVMQSCAVHVWIELQLQNHDFGCHLLWQRLFCSSRRQF